MCQSTSHELELARKYWLAEVNRLEDVIRQAHKKLYQSRTAGTDSHRLVTEAETLLFETLYPEHVIQPGRRQP